MNGWKLKHHPIEKVQDHLNQTSFFFGGGGPHVDFPSVIFSHGPNSDSNILSAHQADPSVATGSLVGMPRAPHALKRNALR